MTRLRYQQGGVTLDKRTKVWFFRWWKGGQRKSRRIGTLEQYPSKSKASKASEGFRLMANSDVEQQPSVRFEAVARRYMAEKMPKRFSTRRGYKSYLENWILPKWGDMPIMGIRPMSVDVWLESLQLAPKSKTHIKLIMRRVFETAMLWELAPLQRNPMDLVRVMGGTKREEEPRILTQTEFNLLLAQLPEEPYRTMVIMVMCLGLRCSELVGLQWGDFDWEDGQLLVQRSVVANRPDAVKTKYSRKHLPIHPELARLLLRWRDLNPFKDLSPWVWPSRAKAGELPLHGSNAQYWRLAPAGERAGLGRIGWHTLRHTYRAWLDETRAPMTVQKDLMRHASITTTMNVYGGALSDSMREANSRIVGLVMDCNRTVQ